MHRQWHLPSNSHGSSVQSLLFIWDPLHPVFQDSNPKKWQQHRRATKLRRMARCVNILVCDQHVEKKQRAHAGWGGSVFNSSRLQVRTFKPRVCIIDGLTSRELPPHFPANAFSSRVRIFSIHPFLVHNQLILNRPRRGRGFSHRDAGCLQLAI